ncbi:RNA 2'-phosphotransferase [Rhizobacter sp. Root1221]|uniref:RNA 2'-phosphotransferase n=1 Tax=Rhizobacter sp. Root1221 TaxID=1736433 RepID=UPI0006FBE3A8|nr:RNA 2'-phosphotransferase [Rhizobacter sp. Root1221]KQV85941.1 RNA 2'-phosphotransferase [Rhizobacter sp. Root1221]
MSTPELTQISKFLSLVLRHNPQRIGIELDAAGWTDIEALLAKAGQAGKPITRELLEKIVAESDKQRFAISDDGSRVRANQGHSVEVDLELPVVAPPELLYHGTADRFLPSILRTGLERRNRHHVHLTANRATAIDVGSRYGRPVVLSVAARRMVEAGHEFRCSANGVWLVEAVAVEFIEVQS